MKWKKLITRVFGIICTVLGIGITIYSISGILSIDTFSFDKYTPQGRDTAAPILVFFMGIALFFLGMDLLKPDNS
jgi:hypothetical protein